MGACVSRPGAPPASRRGASTSANSVDDRPPAARIGRAIAADPALASLQPRPASPPAAPQLRWPDGRLSRGQLESTPSGHYRFRLDQNNEVIEERFVHKPWKRATAPAEPRPLDVARASGDNGQLVVPSLPSLHSLATVRQHGLGFQVATSANGATFAVQPSDLAKLVTAAGGLPGGLNAPQRLAARRLLGDVVAAIADRCTDPEPVRRAASALSEPPWVNVHLVARGDTIHSLGDEAVAGEELFSFQPPEGIDARLSRLEVGAHMVIPWMHRSESSAHAMALGVTRASDTEVRLTAVNSATFHVADYVSSSKVVGLEAAADMLSRLRDGGLPTKPPYMSTDLWRDPGTGAVLLQAMHDADPAAPTDTPPREASTTRQKQPSDCGLESYFAWLSTVLPNADYKLAKAAMLHALGELADHLSEEASPAERELLTQARTRLNERLTTALSGSTVAP